MREVSEEAANLWSTWRQINTWLSAKTSDEAIGLYASICGQTMLQLVLPELTGFAVALERHCMEEDFP